MTEIDSTFLVPGDVFIVNEKLSIPCDSILISGDLLINEASLTGESLPIPKSQLEMNYL